MDKDAALKLALEALEPDWELAEWYVDKLRDKAIAAIKQALEQPEPEPVIFYRCKGCDSMEMRGAFADGWLSAEAAHGIKE